MDIFFQGIWPDLTFGAVLVTFFLVAVGSARFFYIQEKELRKENFDRLTNLVANFRRKHIHPVISNALNRFYTEGQNKIVSDIIDMVFTDTSGLGGSFAGELKPYDELSDELNIEALHSLVSKTDSIEIDKFLSSAEGYSFLNLIDTINKKKIQIKLLYDTSCSSARNLMYICLVLSFLYLHNFPFRRTFWTPYRKQLCTQPFLTVCPKGKLGKRQKGVMCI